MLLSGLGLSACSTMKKATKTQEVVFSDSEVPYFKSVVKDGKVTAELQEPVLN